MLALQRPGAPLGSAAEEVPGQAGGHRQVGQPQGRPLMPASGGRRRRHLCGGGHMVLTRGEVRADGATGAVRLLPDAEAP